MHACVSKGGGGKGAFKHRRTVSSSSRYRPWHDHRAVRVQYASITQFFGCPRLPNAPGPQLPLLARLWMWHIHPTCARARVRRRDRPAACCCLRGMRCPRGRVVSGALGPAAQMPALAAPPLMCSAPHAASAGSLSHKGRQGHVVLLYSQHRQAPCSVPFAATAGQVHLERNGHAARVAPARVAGPA